MVDQFAVQVLSFYCSLSLYSALNLLCNCSLFSLSHVISACTCSVAFMSHPRQYTADGPVIRILHTFHRITRIYIYSVYKTIMKVKLLECMFQMDQLSLIHQLSLDASRKHNVLRSRLGPPAYSTRQYKWFKKALCHLSVFVNDAILLNIHSKMMYHRWRKASNP